MSVRHLADLAEVSNPYLSQIERGLRKPSAEILQQLAKALSISAETLYVRAGLLDESSGGPPSTVVTAIQADPHLNDQQKASLVQIYDSFRTQPAAASPRPAKDVASARPAKPTADEATEATASTIAGDAGPHRTGRPAPQKRATKAPAVRASTSERVTKAPAAKATTASATGISRRPLRSPGKSSVAGNTTRKHKVD